MALAFPPAAFPGVRPHGAVPWNGSCFSTTDHVWANIPSATYMANSGWQGNACMEGIFAVLLSYCALNPD